MNKYNVTGSMRVKGEVEFLILAKSLDDALDLCEEDPRNFADITMLNSKTCEMEFEADEVIEVGKTLISKQ